MAELQLFVEERHAQIVQFLEEHKKAAVADLCRQFQVSGATMRNDLRTLEGDGLITRTHGGAMRRSKTGLELDSSAKRIQNREAKQAIARAAIRLIENGDTIVLDTGTTTLKLARLLGEREDLTVVTNDLAIALVLEEFSGVTTVFMGGIVRRRFHCTVAYGDRSHAELNGITVDKAFMGTNALSITHGASTPDLGTAHAKRGMIAIASTVVMLCDASKFDRSSFAQFASFDEIDILVTDECRAEFRAEMEARGVDVICASSGRTNPGGAQSEQ